MQSDHIIAYNIPRHVGLILDGNRRWAKENGFSSTLQGHKAGYDNLKNLADYAFSRVLEMYLHMFLVLKTGTEVKKRG
ncbi:MAG: undecaprenyl diphosphate synthase family protein [Candidatus Nomurabacteria bacterium]|nr:MAG: undecaprenyl diphosphate synthase family protein [Candidatus Nomurabacteria bacterium]